MTKPTYVSIALLMFTFTLCVVTFVITSDVFQYLLAIFNLGLLFNALRIAVEMEL